MLEDWNATDLGGLQFQQVGRGKRVTGTLDTQIVTQARLGVRSTTSK
jgi:hypothetical protein